MTPTPIDPAAVRADCDSMRDAIRHHAITIAHAQPLVDNCEALLAENSALRAERDELRTHLEGEQKANALLTAGMGSVCEGRDELKHQVRALLAERDAALARVKELEAALRPFADEVKGYEDEKYPLIPDDRSLCDFTLAWHGKDSGPTVGDCCNAAKVLAKAGKDGGE